ncbi:MAG: sensor histidine kinase [Anaerolineales bacterium]|nr:sensor histidine kinase [Anaerolineales bacterium]
MKDSGEGIPPGDRAHIFAPSSCSGWSRDRGGARLGLAIVKALVTAQGGMVQVESPGPGQGSTFSIQFLAESGIYPAP